MGNVLLECKDIIKIYKSTAEVKIAVLRGIDLSIKENSLISIVGPSGAGKTTLLRILGLIESFSSGEVIYNGILGRFNYSEIGFSEKIRLWRELFGFIFQIPNQNLLYNLTAIQNVIFPMKLTNKLSREEQKRRGSDLLKSLDLKKRAHQYPVKLSGGEAQRLSVCVALANDPQIILADEPTGELDSNNTLTLIHLFKELNQNLGKSFVIVTHDLRFKSSTREVYKIRNGRISIF